jgi:hypothetical protein
VRVSTVRRQGLTYRSFELFDPDRADVAQRAGCSLYGFADRWTPEAIVPRYFFNARNENGLSRDEEGLDLPDVEAARAEALKAAQQLWGDLSGHTARNNMAIEITDEAGQTILTVRFTEAAERLAQGVDKLVKGSDAK